MGPISAMAAIIALAGSGIYIGLRSLENYKPNKKKIQRDLKLLKEELQVLLSELVPLTKEEMQLLSFNVVNKKVSKGLSNTKKGYFTSIYHEPLIAWVSRKYLSSKENTLMYARTKKHEFIFRTKKEMTDVVVDEKLLGQITSNRELISMNRKEVLGAIKKEDDGMGGSVWVGKKEIGRMLEQHNAKVSNPRVFPILGGMDLEEKQIFLALTIYEMIKINQVK